MPLYDVTYKPRAVNPEKLEDSEVIATLRRKLHPTTFKRIIKTVDEAVDSIDPSASTRLIWTKAGALFGRNSERPKKHVEHLWDNVIKSVGDNRMCLIGVGSLLRWRISLREETWLVYKRETEIIDEITGRVVPVSEYWIKEDFVLNTSPSRPKKITFGA